MKQIRNTMKASIPIFLLALLPAVCSAQTPVLDLRVGQSVKVAYLESTETVTWLPAPEFPACVSVSSSGVVTALTPGVCGVNFVAISDNLRTGERPILIRVREAAVATTVVITVPDTTLVVGEKVRCTAEVRDQFDEPMGVQVVWRSTNKSYVTISSSGLMTGRQVGSANIYAIFGALQSVRIPVTVE
jgi:Bacterial Ig-like domain (group 2)